MIKYQLCLVFGNQLCAFSQDFSELFFIRFNLSVIIVNLLLVKLFLHAIKLNLFLIDKTTPLSKFDINHFISNFLFLLSIINFRGIEFDLFKIFRTRHLKQLYWDLGFVAKKIHPKIEDCSSITRNKLVFG